MGFLTDLFGDEGDRADIYNDLFGQAQDTLREGFTEYQQYLTEAMQFLMGERASNIEQYRADYQRGIASLEQAISTARSGMEDAFAQQRSLLSEGFDATKRSISGQFDQAAGRLDQQQAFTGLANTSMAGSQDTALMAERGRRLGLVDERQRMAQADLLGQQTRLSTQFNMQAGQSLMQAQAGLARGTLAGQQSYVSPAFGALTSLASAAQNTYGGIAGLQSGLGDRLAANVGSGFNLGGVLTGAAIGTGLNAIVPGSGSAMMGWPQQEGA